MGIYRRAAGHLLRLIPTAPARGLSSYWRDMERLAAADAALVSFPKSGRTFVRVMLARLYQREHGIDEREVLKFATLRRASRGVPRLLFTHNGDAMRPPADIQIDRPAFGACKVALLARHPGDVVVSRYFHLKHRSQCKARQRLARQPIDDFAWTPNGGVPSIVTFLNQWAATAREDGNVLIARYEDFLTAPEAALERLARFIGLSPCHDAVRDAVGFARFENLRQKERDGYFTSARLGPGRAKDDNSFKVRSGTAGGYRAKLDRACGEQVDAYVRDHLDPLFGY